MPGTAPEQLLSSVELEQLGRGTDRPDADWTDDFNAQVLEVALDRARPHFEPMTWCISSVSGSKTVPPRKPPMICRSRSNLSIMPSREF